MNGTIAISCDELIPNYAQFNIFDLFKLKLKSFTNSTKAGWYAYKEINGIYYFLWTDNQKLSEKYLKALEKDNYILAYNNTYSNVDIISYLGK